MLGISDSRKYINVSELFRSSLNIYQNNINQFLKVITPIFLLSLILDILLFSGINKKWFCFFGRLLLLTWITSLILNLTLAFQFSYYRTYQQI